MSEAEDLILGLEQRRLDALCRGDMEDLRAMLADDLVHVHGTGVVEDRDSYLATMDALDVESADRISHEIRAISPDVILSHGALRQKLRFKSDDRRLDMTAYVSQVWRNEGDCWKLCSFQATATNIPAP